MSRLRGLFAPLLAFALILALESAGAPALATGGANTALCSDEWVRWGKTLEKTFLGVTVWKVHLEASYDYQSCVNSNGPNFVKSREVHSGCVVQKGGSHLNGATVRYYMWDRRGHNRHPETFLWHCGPNGSLHDAEDRPMKATPFLYYSRLRRPPKGRVYMVVYPRQEHDMEWMSSARSLR